MSTHPHTSRYARLVAGFAASAFALLVASAVHYAEAQDAQLNAEVSTSTTIAKNCARTGKALDKCAARAVKCTDKAAIRQPLCMTKAQDRLVKCNNRAAKKLTDCQATANTQEKQAKCARKFDKARVECATTYDKAVLKCGTLESVAAACNADKAECESDARESFTRRTGLIYEQACAG